MGRKRVAVPAAVACSLLAGCARHNPVICLDHGWNLYYAKNTCYLYLPQGDRDPALQACLNREIQGLENFEKALLSELGTHPECAGVRIERAADQGLPSGSFWRLLIDFDDPEGKREKWDLMSPKAPGMRHGSGDAREIAQRVCALAKA